MLWKKQLETPKSFTAYFSFDGVMMYNSNVIKTKDKTIRTCLQLGFSFLIAQLAIFALFWRKLPPQVPLFYSRPWGGEQLVNPIGLLLLPAISLLITVVNLAAVSPIPGEEKLASQLLVVFATVFNFLCLITLFKIVTLVT